MWGVRRHWVKIIKIRSLHTTPPPRRLSMFPDGQGTLNKNKELLLLLGFSELMGSLTPGIMPFYWCISSFRHKGWLAKENRKPVSVLQATASCGLLVVRRVVKILWYCFWPGAVTRPSTIPYTLATQSMVRGPAALAPIRSLLHTQTLGGHSRPTESECDAQDPQVICMNINFRTHCLTCSLSEELFALWKKW